jgi:hypothetical protein
MWRRLALAGVGLGFILRCSIGVMGAPAIRTVSELGLVVIALGVGMAALARLAGATRVMQIAVGAALVAWAGGVSLPLWRVGHPAAVLYQGRIGGATREVMTGPVPARGRYQIQFEAPAGALSGGRAAPYLLHIAQGSSDQISSGALDGQLQSMEVVLQRGQPLRLFFEQLPSVLDVRVRPSPIPALYIQLAGLAAALLATLADLIGRRARVRGVLAAAVAASAVFVAVLHSEGDPGWRLATGAALLALVGGGLHGGLVGLIGAVWARRARPPVRRPRRRRAMSGRPMIGRRAAA